jgi:hypothetical protein
LEICVVKVCENGAFLKLMINQAKVHDELIVDSTHDIKIGRNLLDPTVSKNEALPNVGEANHIDIPSTPL